jgi:uncharacterized protein
MTPQFKSGNYDKGIEDGAAAVIAQLEGRTDAVPADAPAISSVASGSPFHIDMPNQPDIPWPMRILLGAFIFGIIGLFTFVGIMTPGVGWFLYVFLIPFWAMFPLMIIGPYPTLALLATYVIGYPITKLILGRTAWYQKAATDLKTKGHTNIGGFVMSTSGGGGSSSFSSDSGGGGFSGGGGSSGGGGASGSW